MLSVTNPSSPFPPNPISILIWGMTHAPSSPLLAAAPSAAAHQPPCAEAPLLLVPVPEFGAESGKMNPCTLSVIPMSPSTIAIIAKIQNRGRRSQPQWTRCAGGRASSRPLPHHRECQICGNSPNSGGASDTGHSSGPSPPASSSTSAQRKGPARGTTTGRHAPGRPAHPGYARRR